MCFIIWFSADHCDYISADDLSSQGQWTDMDQLPVAGLNSILSKEHGNKFYNLPIIRHLEKDVGAVAAWDSSVHDSEYLNRVTESKSHYIPDCENKYCFDILMSVLVYLVLL